MRYKYGSFNDNLFNSTLLLKNISNTAWVCTDAFENYMIYLYAKLSTFKDPTSYFMAFFQNLLANIINLNNIYKVITTNVVTGNEVDTYF